KSSHRPYLLGRLKRNAAISCVVGHAVCTSAGSGGPAPPGAAPHGLAPRAESLAQPGSSHKAASRAGWKTGGEGVVGSGIIRVPVTRRRPDGRPRPSRTVP